MNDEYHSNGHQIERSWLERIGHALLGEPKDHEQLLDLLQSAQQRDLLEADALHMIEGVLDVGKMQVRDIMIPRSQMIVVEQDSRLEDILPKLCQSGHSRFPVIGDDRDNVVGILLAKDLLPYVFNETPARFNIRNLMRPVTIVPESKRLNVLLRDFRSKRNHMAIVVDEYGGVSGLVTIEDVLEEIVGDIADEHDVESEEPFIKQNSNNEFAIRALTPIETFNDYFHADYNEEEFDTMGGLIMKEFGHIPKFGEAITLGHFQFTVNRVEKRRIKSLIATRV